MTDTIPTTPPLTGGRERILEEALALFTTSGFAAVSMQQIADAAGVTKATLYHHFRDKEALFLDVVHTGLARSGEHLAAAVTCGDTLHEQLRSVARYLFGSQRSDLARLLGDLHQHVTPERQEALWRSGQQPWICLEGAITAGIASGEIAPVDPAVTARLLFGTMASQLQFARYHRTVPQPDDALAEQIVALFMSGLRPR